MTAPQACAYVWFRVNPALPFQRLLTPSWPQRALALAQADALRAVATMLRASASLMGFGVFSVFSFVLMQSSLRVPLADALKSADVLVTAVFGVGGWLFVKFLDTVNERFNSVDERFNSVEARFNSVEKTLQELKVLIQQLPPARS